MIFDVKSCNLAILPSREDGLLTFFPFLTWSIATLLTKIARSQDCKVASANWIAFLDASPSGQFLPAGAVEVELRGMMRATGCVR